MDMGNKPIFSYHSAFFLASFFCFSFALSSCGGVRSNPCQDGYHVEGGKCELNIRSCSIPNGSGGEQIWGDNGYKTCAPASCKVGYYDNQKGSCVKVEPGYISAEGDLEQTRCEGNTVPDDKNETCVSCDPWKHANATNSRCDLNDMPCNPPVSATHGRKARIWNGKTYNACTLVACDPGYDDNDGDRVCKETITGHYSPAGTTERIACVKPERSSWISGTGLDSVWDCIWACDGGYDNQANNHLCEETIARHYSPAGDSQRTACTKPNNSSWTTTTGLTSVVDCATQAWRCNAGYDNQETQPTL